MLKVQGAYYLVTGLWPWFSLATFERVTGPKTDDWLVQTVGALAAAIGAALLVAARREALTQDAKVLAVLSAAAFAFVDVLFVALGTISRIYLADAAIQGGFVAGACSHWLRAGENQKSM
jgi:hypothetical protein